MKKEYVFLDLKNYKKAKYIECIKVNDECKVSTLKYEYKKELEKNWNYTEDEYLYLKNNGANFITNIFHISDSTIKLTSEYTIYSDNKLKYYKYMVDKMKGVLEYIKEHPDLNIKLVCIGNLEELKGNYKVLGKDSLEIILNLIVKEKELWSNW